MTQRSKKLKIDEEEVIMTKEVIEIKDDSSVDEIKNLEPPIPPNYIIEIAKSGRSECQKCNSKILKDEVRCGIITEGEWGLFTKWQHLNCTIFHRSIEYSNLLDGYHELNKEQKDLVDIRVHKSKKEIDSDYIPVSPDELVRKDWTEVMEAPSELLMPLLSYQKEGLGWMVHQEYSSMAGGILADEMGMGKTIQAISLILQNRASTTNLSKEISKMWSDSEKSHLESQDMKLVRGKTLIVLPTIAIRQWQSEIFRFTKEGSLKVTVYHGADRSDFSLKSLADADIVITSYKIIEIDYRKATAGCKIECRLCGKKFYPEKLRLHRKYFCGETAVRTEAQSKTEKKKQSSTSVVKPKTSDVVDSSSEEEEEEEEEEENTKSVKSKVAGKVTQPTKSKAKEISTVKPIKTTTKYSKEKEKLTEKNNNNNKSRQSNTVSEAAKASPSAASSRPQRQAKKTVNYAIDSKVSDDESDDFISLGKRNSTGKKITKKEENINNYGTDSSFSDTSEEDDDDDDDSNEEDEKEEENFVTSKTKGSFKPNQKKSSTVSNLSSKRAADDFDKKADKKKVTKKGNKKSFEEEVLVVENQSDSEVERDIAKALKYQKKQPASESVLHKISWFRVILDEAHLIKDRSTSTAKAVFNLISLNKWCLTGTPLQNRVGELYSLIRFLRIDPHAYYFCRTKNCECKSLHYRFTRGKCDECDHTVMNHFCHFNKHILNPIKRSGYIGEGRKAMLKLKEQVLDEILLRRTKTSRADDIELPMRIVKVRKDALDEKEDDFYQALYTQSQAQFNTYIASGTVLNNYAHIFDILIRLRQAVDHPYLVIHSATNSNSSSELVVETSSSSTTNPKKKAKSNEKDQDCCICHDPVDELDGIKATCGHVFCKLCIEEYISTITDKPMTDGEKSGANCPSCFKPLTLSLISESNSISIWDNTLKRRKSILDKINLSEFQSSTKLEALMQELTHMQRDDLGAKAIVFSQFVNMLDLIEYRLQTGGISCVKLQGSMNIDQRDKVLKEFNENHQMKVLLISLKAGGVALNLTVANYIYIMDPWWNPAAEMQAIDRTHRLGQHKPIYATRFIISNTIEERILKLQEKKKLVFDGTVGGDACSMAKLTVDDMRFLFQ